jgi:O-antigen/teichoic acid export membrane protein
LLGNMFLNLSFTSHYALMAIEKDKALMWIGIGIAILTILGNLIAINLFGITGGVSVFVLSSILFFITKSYAEKTYFRRYEW